MVTADGKPLQMIANANEGRNAAGKALFMQLALIKATDRRRYERDLLAAREVAKTDLASERESSELREQFIAVLGHDLRNPLASISAGARCWDAGQKPIKSRDTYGHLNERGNPLHLRYAASIMLVGSLCATSTLIQTGRL